MHQLLGEVKLAPVCTASKHIAAALSGLKLPTGRQQVGAESYVDAIDSVPKLDLGWTGVGCGFKPTLSASVHSDLIHELLHFTYTVC